MRLRRKSLGLTLVQLAERSGLSQPFLSQVERGRARPSMRSLGAIAGALATTAPALLSLPEQSALALVGPLDGPAVETSGGGTARSIAQGAREMLPMEFLGGPREYDEYLEHEGEEFLYVVTGVIEVDLAGQAPRRVAGRESLYYPATVPHRWRVLEDPVWLLAVSTRAH